MNHGYEKKGEDERSTIESSPLSRRAFLRLAGVSGAALSVGGGFGVLIAACGGEEAAVTTTMATASTDTTAATTMAGGETTVVTAAENGPDIKLGLVAPKTGALGTYGFADEWWRPHAMAAIGDGIVLGDGKKHKIQVSVRDTQSDSNRAAQVAADLILNENAQMIMSSGSPDTVVPMADQCETLGRPGICIAAPWQAIFARPTTPKEGYKWIWGNCLGSEQTMVNYLEMFNQVPNNKIVGMLFPNSADAAAWMAPSAAPAVFEEVGGYKLVVPDFYPEGAEDFTSQITVFKREGCDIICGSNTPPSFTNFVKQAVQQGFKPKILSSGLVLGFPEVPADLSGTCLNMSGEMAFNPLWPFKDSLTGMTCQEIADEFEEELGRQWSMVIGTYGGFEWCVDILKRAADPEDPESLVAVIPATNCETIQGPVDFTQPVDMNSRHCVPNNVKCPFAGGQWVKGTGKWKVDYVQCSNAAAEETTPTAKALPMVYF